MRLTKFLSSRRLMFGGIAAALGFSSVAVPIVVDSAAASPVEGPGPIQPDTISAPGTYESCSAYFGLTKQNSNLAQFDIVNNTTGPDPIIADTEQAGPTLVPVVTLTDASNAIVECTPEPGWTDQTSWENDYLQSMGMYFVGNLLQYPGTGFWLLPALGEMLGHFDQSQNYLPFLPVTGTLRFESNLTGTPIHSSMIDLPTTDAGFDGNIGMTIAMLQSPLWPAALDIVSNAPTGDAAQAALLDAIVDGLVNGPTLCDNGGIGLLVPDADFTPLRATLGALIPAYSNPDCAHMTYSGSWLFEGQLQRAKVANAPVTITVGDPAPPTTTTTTVAPDEPITPAFTG